MKVQDLQLIRAGLSRSSNPLLQLMATPIGDLGEWSDKMWENSKKFFNHGVQKIGNWIK